LKKEKSVEVQIIGVEDNGNRVGKKEKLFREIKPKERRRNCDRSIIK